MKGLALMGKKDVRWIEKPRPKPGAFDVICKPVAVCPCTTDAHCVEHFPFPHMQGIILGHEAIGKIVETGEGVKDFKSGDIVVVPSVTPQWNALEVQDGLSKFSNGSGYLFTQKKDGVFAEYFHVNDADQNLAHLPQNMSPKEAIMAVDMLATACAGAEQAQITFGDTVVIFGIGPVGLLSIAAARQKGAGKIIALGSRKKCIDLAYTYGADIVIDYHRDDLIPAVLASNHQKPVDVAITAGGGSGVISTALEMVKMGGMISNVAGFTKEKETILSNDAWFLGTSDKTIKGTMVPGGRRYMERMLALISSRRIDVSPIADPVLYGFDNILTALNLMVQKPDTIIKPVVLLEESN